MDKPFNDNPNLLKHLSIVPTAELLEELHRRFEASIFLGFTTAPKKSGLITSYYDGPNTILIGLLDGALVAHRNWTYSSYDEEG